MTQTIDIQGPFRPKKHIVLASASPRRQSLLSGLGLNFQVIPSQFKEPPPKPYQDPGEYVLQNAEAKASQVLKQIKPSLILAADTVVVLDKNILGKPKDKSEALKYLQMLCGRVHLVLTACCFLDSQTGEKESFQVKTEVDLPKWDYQILRAYVDTKEPLDKAGAYAIQGLGAFMVQGIKGSYTNVVGLPLTETVLTLQKMKAICLMSNKV